jgi:hypothetical protein
MPAQLLIADGPVGREWDSDSIRIRSTRATSLTTVGPHINPQSGSDYFTYVKVENTGTDPFGACGCSTTGSWAIRSNFINVSPPTTGPNGQTLVVAAGFATLTQGATQLGQWLFATGDFWSWSPGGRFFAYVHRDLSVSPTWTVSVIAASAFTKTPPAVGATPITVTAGAVLDTVGPTLSASPQAISGVNLGWNPAGTCLHIDQPPLPNQPPLEKYHLWICPLAGTTGLAQTYSLNSILMSGEALSFLYSPCGDLAAILRTPGGPLVLIDLRTALETPARANNVVTSVSVTGASPTITTTGQGRLGLTLTQASSTAIDNPECLKGGSVTVEARRVLCSTMPGAMAPVQVGSGPSAAAIWPGASIWVEIPRHRFTRLGTVSPEHWCMQARADGTTNGDPAPAWSAFVIADRHFAQRNVAII